MLILSQSKKIALIALSLFFVSLSIVFVVSSQEQHNGETTKNNVFASFFSASNVKETESGPKNLDAIQEPALALTKSGEFSALNQAFTEEFGYRKDYFTENKFFSLIHAEDLPNFVGSFTKAVQEEKEIYSGPFRLKLANGDYHLVIMSMSVNESSIHILFKDISESIEDLEETKGVDGKTIKELQDKDGARIVVEKY